MEQIHRMARRLAQLVQHLHRPAGARRALQHRAPTLLATAAPALPRDAAEAPAPAVLQHDAAPGVDGAAALAPAAPPPPSIVFPASGET